MTEPCYVTRRVNPRYPFFAEAEANFPDGACLPVQISELSACGCYVDALQPIPIGTEMDLYICYGVNACAVKGKVIYKHSGGGLGIFGMGVVFERMNPEQHYVIDGWLGQVARQGTGGADRSSITPAQA